MPPWRHTRVTNFFHGNIMDLMKRFAVYFAPRPGRFATAAAALVGWDNLSGTPVAHPDLPGLPAPLADLTTNPRKYGFHGTVRAPFRPAPGVTAQDVSGVVQALSQQLDPATCSGLQLANLHGFLALTLSGDPSEINTLAAQVVRATNPLRAPLLPEERAKRRPESLSPRQRLHLDTWGYPHVMEDMHFHLTLTNRLAGDQADQVARILSAHLAPVLPNPFTIDDLCLFGEDDSGSFHLLHRFPLSG